MLRDDGSACAKTAMRGGAGEALTAGADATASAAGAHGAIDPHPPGAHGTLHGACGDCRRGCSDAGVSAV